MSKAAKSVFVFGAYIFVVGISLMAIPNFSLVMFGLDEATDVWVRAMGLLTFYLGFYYMMCARMEIAYFFKLTVYVRFSVIFFFTAFVLLGYAKWPLILFAVVDFLGGIWTAIALKSSKSN